MSIIQNRKAQKSINNTILSLVGIILITIVIFSVYGAVVPDVQTAGDSMNDSNRCVAVGCFFNSTTDVDAFGGCRINSSIQGNATQCTTQSQTIPLSSLFSGTGVVVLILMVFIFMVILKVVLPKGKK